MPGSDGGGDESENGRRGFGLRIMVSLSSSWSMGWLMVKEKRRAGARSRELNGPGEKVSLNSAASRSGGKQLKIDQRERRYYVEA